MLLNKRVNWIFLALFCALLSGCVSSRDSKDSVSDKEKAAVNLQMGTRYLEMNMLETAKEKLDEAAALDSNNAGIYNALGVLHERLKQYEKAGAEYKKAIEINSNDASIQNNYGRFLCERGDFQGGLELLNQALEMPFNNRKWFAYTNIGRCELGRGDHALAESNFRQALQENRKYSPALSEMQKISYQTENYMSARAFLQRYLAVAKHSAETLWYGVQTERALGNKKMSEQFRELLLKRFPASKEAQQVKTAIR